MTECYLQTQECKNVKVMARDYCNLRGVRGEEGGEKHTHTRTRAKPSSPNKLVHPRTFTHSRGPIRASNGSDGEIHPLLILIMT